MTVELTNDQMGKLYEIMSKYEDVNESFSDSLSKVIQKSNNDDDLLNISQHMDYRDIDFEDSEVLDRILGVSIGVVCFNF
ncbi:MAG: hypothetical protein SLAVMIC_00264 [uncultured marine phage]|uniref:Uncharacterized protein n=1 Tax=uncultured marine phage TaxID=707152 RepID=A0A8D9CBA2_9VIRU|nr:MAG: hypothetical protein SLAVMIC_00264 [uncultured marine phage]